MSLGTLACVMVVVALVVFLTAFAIDVTVAAIIYNADKEADEFVAAVRRWKAAEEAGQQADS
jgi:hypothetical protein